MLQKSTKTNNLQVIYHHSPLLNKLGDEVIGERLGGGFYRNEFRK